MLSVCKLLSLLLALWVSPSSWRCAGGQRLCGISAVRCIVFWIDALLLICDSVFLLLAMRAMTVWRLFVFIVRGRLKLEAV